MVFVREAFGELQSTFGDKVSSEFSVLEAPKLQVQRLCDQVLPDDSILVGLQLSVLSN